MEKNLALFTAALNKSGEDENIFSFVAYAGKPIDGYPYPLLVDLKGMDLKRFKANPVILWQHDRNEVIGSALKIKVENSELLVDIKLTDVTEKSKEVSALIKDGCLKAVSWAALPVNIEILPEGKKATINGTDYVGPLTVFRKCELFEISVVSVPRDPKALRYASLDTEEITTQNEVNDMDKDKQIEELKAQIVVLEKAALEKDEKIGALEKLPKADEFKACAEKYGFEFAKANFGKPEAELLKIRLAEVEKANKEIAEQLEKANLASKQPGIPFSTPGDSEKKKEDVLSEKAKIFANLGIKFNPEK